MTLFANFITWPCLLLWWYHSYQDIILLPMKTIHPHDTTSRGGGGGGSAFREVGIISRAGGHNYFHLTAAREIQPESKLSRHIHDSCKKYYCIDNTTDHLTLLCACTCGVIMYTLTNGTKCTFSNTILLK